MSAHRYPLPQDIVRSLAGDRVVLTKKWRRPAAWLVVGFTVVWDAFLVIWYYVGLRDPDTSWVMFVFPILHIVFGLVLTYLSLGLMLNRTVIELSPDLLRVSTAPIPYHREVRLVPSEICDVRYHEHVRRGYSSVYDVRTVDAAGEETNLLKGLGEYSEVCFYIAELRDLLGLPASELTRGEENPE